MKIWLIKDGEPLPLSEHSQRLRMANLAAALSDRGHEVTWWSTTFSHYDMELYFQEDTTQTVLNGVVLRALDCGSYTANVSLSRYRHHARFAKRFIDAADEQTKPDLIVSALPIHQVSLNAVRWGHQHGIPVVVDLRDKWPDIFVDQLPSAVRGLGRFLFWREFRAMKLLCQEADALTAMMDSMLDWALKEHAQRDAGWQDRVFYLGGERSPDDEPFATLFPEIAEKLQDRFVVCYTGSFGHYNGPRDIVEAAKSIKQNHPDAEIAFLLAGKGELFDETRDLAADLDNVYFPGWLNARQLDAITKVSDIGVIPWASGFAFPNKAFSYLGAGLPILTSAEGDLKNLLSEHSAGHWFKAGAITDLGEMIYGLSIDRDRRNTMSDQAQLLFDSKLKSSQIYPEFAQHLEKVAEAGVKNPLGLG